LGERRVRNAEVGSSSLLPSTTLFKRRDFPFCPLSAHRIDHLFGWLELIARERSEQTQLRQAEPIANRSRRSKSLEGFSERRHKCPIDQVPRRYLTATVRRSRSQAFPHVPLTSSCPTSQSGRRSRRNPAAILSCGSSAAHSRAHRPISNCWSVERTRPSRC